MLVGSPDLLSILGFSCYSPESLEPSLAIEIRPGDLLFFVSWDAFNLNRVWLVFGVLMAEYKL